MTWWEATPPERGLRVPKPYMLPRYLTWLLEDCFLGDVTTEALIGPGTVVEAHVISEDEAVAACMDEAVGMATYAGVSSEPLVRDGEPVKAGEAVMVLRGEAPRVLLVERALLNMLTYCYSVATTTKLMVRRAAEGRPGVRVAATRKAPPGLLYLAKKAVAAGGGDTHRLSLSHMILIKDNHLKIVGDVARAVSIARKKASFTTKVEVEVESPQQALQAARAGADIIMLDNMSPEQVREAVALLEAEGLRKRVTIEASGGVNLDNVSEYAAAGVDVVSSSILTMNPLRRGLKLEVVKVIRGGEGVLGGGDG